MSVSLADHQWKAIDEMRNGKILCGTVGSGKSRTALAYYILKECEGRMKIGGVGSFHTMKQPRDLYIITTAKKRDSLEWEKEAAAFGISKEDSAWGTKFVVDSWNNIKKYDDVYGAMFIFDEQRVVGSGAWVKAFLNITRKNHWILLSATPGDKWEDYIPVFVANGFYRNKSDFQRQHCVFRRFVKFPQVERYLEEKKLGKLRDDILVKMKDPRETTRHMIKVDCLYDKELYRRVYRDRWDPFEGVPIQETGKLFYLLRWVVNSDESRIQKVKEILEEKERCIIFYNFTYELNILRAFCQAHGVTYAEWNGEKHQEVPNGERWVYLVQYLAGSEGWNCIETDTIIFYSQNYSYRALEQASGRIDRMNTPYRDLYYYRLMSGAMIDRAINNALSKKKNFNERSVKL